MRPTLLFSLCLWRLVGLGLGDFEQKSSARDPRLQYMLRVGLLLLLVGDFYFAISQWKNSNEQSQSKFGAVFNYSLIFCFS
jgi:hypothetical protein